MPTIREQVEAHVLAATAAKNLGVLTARADAGEFLVANADLFAAAEETAHALAAITLERDALASVFKEKVAERDQLAAYAGQLRAELENAAKAGWSTKSAAEALHAALSLTPPDAVRQVEELAAMHAESCDTLAKVQELLAAVTEQRDRLADYMERIREIGRGYIKELAAEALAACQREGKGKP